MVPPRTLLRSRQIRADLPNTHDADRDEESYLRGRYFEADCLTSDAIGDFIHIRADEIAGFIQVEKVDIADPLTMPAIGIITEKATSTRCFVQTLGILEVSGLTAGSRYWVGSDTKLSVSPPARVVGVSVVAQIVGVALTSGRLLLNPQLQAVKLRAL